MSGFDLVIDRNAARSMTLDRTVAPIDVQNDMIRRINNDPAVHSVKITTSDCAYRPPRPTTASASELERVMIANAVLPRLDEYSTEDFAVRAPQVAAKIASASTRRTMAMEPLLYG